VEGRDCAPGGAPHAGRMPAMPVFCTSRILTRIASCRAGGRAPGLVVLSRHNVKMTLLFHILAGALGLVLGAVALSATKGATLHRRSGIVFVYAMLTMSVSAIMMASLRGVAPAVNIPAGLLTAYLVITALTALRPRTAASRLVDLGAMLVAFGVGLISVALGLEALARGIRTNWIVSIPFLVLGVVGLLAGASDLHLMRSEGMGGAPRLARHLWRMCFALLIAATAFFLGQPDVFPKALRIPALLALPVLAVLTTMLYWLWRVRIKGGYRAVIGDRRIPPGSRLASRYARRG